MYAVDLICSNGHTFESWFRNRKSMEEQMDAYLLECPMCGDASIKQIISPARIGKHANMPTSQNHKDGESTHLDLSKMIELAFEDVGEDFYDEAIKMYTGESEKRAIKGTLTENEEAELDEEGISFFKLPNIQ